jgi:hypothetical protein
MTHNSITYSYAFVLIKFVLLAPFDLLLATDIRGRRWSGRHVLFLFVLLLKMHGPLVGILDTFGNGKITSEGIFLRMTQRVTQRLEMNKDRAIKIKK